MGEEGKDKEINQNVLQKAKIEVENIIKRITESGLQDANVELLNKLIDIHKDIENEEYWKKKEENMMYRDYDNYDGGRSRDSRGRYMEGSYERRGVPGSGRGRYRGYDYIDEMGKHYGDYIDGREVYGNDRETEKSFDKMLDCFEGFAFSIMEEANEPEKVEKIKRTARKISEM